MPSGKVAQPSITDNKDGTVTVRYSPSEAGLHEMDIRYDNMHIPGGPTAHSYILERTSWGGVISQLVDCWPSMYEVLNKLGIMAHACNPSTGGKRIRNSRLSSAS